jgi:hypothetical protein
MPPRPGTGTLIGGREMFVRCPTEAEAATAEATALVLEALTARALVAIAEEQHHGRRGHACLVGNDADAVNHGPVAVTGAVDQLQAAACDQGGEVVWIRQGGDRPQRDELLERPVNQKRLFVGTGAAHDVSRNGLTTILRKLRQSACAWPCRLGAAVRPSSCPCHR